MDQGTIPLYGNPGQRAPMTEEQKAKLAAGRAKKAREAARAAKGTAITVRPAGSKLQPGKSYKKLADGRVVEIAKKKPKKNPADFVAFAKSIIKSDGAEIAEGLLVFLVAKFLYKKFLAGKIVNPTLMKFEDVITGLIGASFEVYRGKRTGAIVSISAGVASVAVNMLAAKLAGAPVQGADYDDIEDYEIREAAPVSGDFDGDPVDAILDAEDDQVEGYGDNRGGSFDY